jgi:hypothetical protein
VPYLGASVTHGSMDGALTLTGYGLDWGLRSVAGYTCENGLQFGLTAGYGGSAGGVTGSDGTRFSLRAQGALLGGFIGLRFLAVAGKARPHGCACSRGERNRHANEQRGSACIPPSAVQVGSGPRGGALAESSRHAAFRRALECGSGRAPCATSAVPVIRQLEDPACSAP